MKARILIGWELGAGLGHVGMLLPVARALRQRGYEPVLALRDLTGPAAMLADEGIATLQAPVSPIRKYAEKFIAASYADILASTGYDDAVTLQALVRGWLGLLETVRPAAVICESAPVLAMTAKGRVPALVMGDGFSLPPAGGTAFPLFQSDGKPVLAQDTIHQTVTAVQRQTGGAVPETLPEILAGDARMLCTVPELDPYAGDRDETCAGPLAQLPAPTPGPDTAGFFAYLGGDLAYVPNMLRGLNRCGIDGGVYVHKPTADIARDLPRSNFKAFDGPQPFERVIPAATMVVHHASMGTSLAALAAGRPQVVVPRHLQNTLVADCLVRSGVGLRLPRDLSPDRMVQAVNGVAADTAMQDRALELGRDIAARDYGDVAGRVAEACAALT